MNVPTLSTLLDAEAVRHPGRRLLLDTAGRTLTVADVAHLSRRAAQWLTEVGVRPGMTVAWQLPSHLPAAVLSLALARMPVRQAPIIHINRSREVSAAVGAACADLLIVDDTTAANTPPGLAVIELARDWLASLRAPAAHDPDVTPHPASDVAWVYFTSGSTGRPKAVTHTDASLLTAARGFTSHLGLGSVADEVSTIAFPIAHVGGAIMLASALIGGFAVLTIPQVEPSTLPQTLTEHAVTVTGGSPTIYQMLLSAQLSCLNGNRVVPSLRMLVGGGAACPEALHQQVRRHLGIPILHAYGMTEAPMVCVTMHTDTEEQHIHTSGYPIPGSEIRIGPGDEIEIRGASVTPGYLDAQQWAAALTPDGWFRTGDCGYLRPDGRIVITGRHKDLIIRKGENIAPAEIEHCLLHHPLVDDVVVVGLPDIDRGELVCAVVRRPPGLGDVTLEELCDFLAKQGLMKQKWPERLVIVDQFPTTGLGKVARAEIARQIGAMP